ncbi:MAG: endonuclease [Candidatus Marinimicrobia bacterium]|nr:endonuclease [Candidatus Neomarinimicrobiota bacterium]
MYKIFILLFFTVSLLSAAIPEGYYAGAEGKVGEELKHALHLIIRGHTRISYSAAYSALKDTDEDPLNPQNVILLYTGRSQDQEYQDHGASYNYEQFGGTYDDAWNREHVWPKSHGFPNETDTAYTDIHHLRPADRSVNSARLNKDFDWGTTRHPEATECFYTATSWEPRNAVKGDVARMVFYMTVRYESTQTYDLEMVDYTGTPNEPILGKKSTLLEWHLQDPPDDFEKRRNEVIYSIQHNRNPFIDHPEFAMYIWRNVPNPPANLQIIDVSDSSATLLWTDQSDNEEGFNIYVNREWHHSTPANTTETVITSLSPGTHYLFGVRAFNADGESVVAEISGMTSGGESGPVYISEFSDASGSENFYYEFFELVNMGSAAANVSGFRVHQIESTREFTLPENTYIPARGTLIIGRHASRDDFEAFWNVSLDESAVYINSMNVFPMINGLEHFCLTHSQDLAIDPADGEYTAANILEGERAQRITPGNSPQDWDIAPDSLATPGWSPLVDTTYVSVSPLKTPVPEILEPSVTIYPNPVNYIITLSLKNFHPGNVHVKIFNLLGKLMVEQHVSFISPSSPLQLDARTFSSGVYIIQITQNHLKAQNKILVLK